LPRADDSIHKRAASLAQSEGVPIVSVANSIGHDVLLRCGEWTGDSRQNP